MKQEYVMLKAGEIIREGDETTANGKRWEKVSSSIGQKLAMSFGGMFRRPIASPSAQDGQNFTMPKLDFVLTDYSTKIIMTDFGGARDIHLLLHWNGGLNPDQLIAFEKQVVKAVNAHQGLVDALKDLIGAAESSMNGNDEEENESPINASLWKAIEKSRAALKG